jgi:hypothetical protein
VIKYLSPSCAIGKGNRETKVGYTSWLLLFIYVNTKVPIMEYGLHGHGWHIRHHLARAASATEGQSQCHVKTISQLRNRGTE